MSPHTRLVKLGTWRREIEFEIQNQEVSGLGPEKIAIDFALSGLKDKYPGFIPFYQIIIMFPTRKERTGSSVFFLFELNAMKCARDVTNYEMLVKFCLF